MTQATQAFAELPPKSRPGVQLHRAQLRPGVGAVALQKDWEDEEITDPRAEGACLFDLTPEEWRLVRNAPLAGFLIVAGADGQVLPKERRALVSALEDGRRSSSELFRAVCRELYRQRDTLVELFVTDTFEQGQLAEATRLVILKLGEQEAELFRASVLGLGRRVAKASGGLVASWGWLRAEERRALAELSLALGAHGS
jgi:tellurite resistance protein